MQISEKGLQLIRDFEWKVLQAYQDTNGIWTIGYGHTHGVYKGQTITSDQAEVYLKEDAAEFSGYVNSLVHVPLNQNQFDALTSFVFNLGPGSLSSSTLLRLLNAGDYKGAAAQFPRWVKDQQGNTLAGLVRRREAERQLFLSDGI